MHRMRAGKAKEGKGMILQTFVLPGEVCRERDVYYHAGGNVRYGSAEQALMLEPDSSVASNTYMNLFDVTAWKKYTAIKSLKLCFELSGQGAVEIWNSTGDGEVLYDECAYQTNQRQTAEIKLDAVRAGKTYFKIRAKTGTTLYKAYYECEDPPKQVLLSLVICTYKREWQLRHNIEKLLQSEFWKEGSNLYHKLYVRVVDNASELTLPKKDNLGLYHNPNTGGSGGFIRGITETQNEHGQYGTTHIILMDDDVEFETETLYRIYALLSYIKPEYREEVIAGRMFRLDNRKIQYTASEIWNGGKIRHLGGNLDVTRQESLKDINEQRGEYSGWWLAVFPYEFTVDNLPLPFFLHCDDVEYGLRHGGSPIVLNGVQVWHETYEYRQSPVITYYDTRNSLIVNAIYGYGFEAQRTLECWKRRVQTEQENSNYLYVYMLLAGVNDFCKGRKYLWGIDGAEKHKKLQMKKASRLENRILQKMYWLNILCNYNKSIKEFKKLQYYNMRRKSKKMQKPYVSIIVPVCNVEHFLSECLDSVIHQTLNNIEIICVNDGSTDSSLSILEEYAQKDNRIKIISKENSGYGNTMNVGIDSAEGEFIGIVESDDYVEKNMFERLYRTAIEYDCQIVKSDHYIFSTKEGKKQKQFQAVCPEQFYGKTLNAKNCPDIFNFTMMNWTGIYKREFLVSNKIRHNETPGASFQDNGFWFQTMALADKIFFLNEAFYYYRQDNPNSSINKKEKVFCICDEYQYIQEFVNHDENIAAQYYQIFFAKKVFNYLHFYDRTSDRYKLEFLYRVAKEFEEDLKNPYINKTEMDSWLMNMVNRIIDCPELFYYEDSQWKMKEEYQRIHQLLMRVRNSKEFDRGLRIKRRLHLKV